MNTAQRQYIEDRIWRISGKVAGKIEKKFNKQINSLRMQRHRKFLLVVKRGEAKVKRNVPDSATMLAEVFQQPKQPAVDKQIKQLIAKKEKAIEQVDEHKDRIRDEIMLGDNSTALKMLRDFEKMADTL